MTTDALIALSVFVALVSIFGTPVLMGGMLWVNQFRLQREARKRQLEAAKQRHPSARNTCPHTWTPWETEEEELYDAHGDVVGMVVIQRRQCLVCCYTDYHTQTIRADY